MAGVLETVNQRTQLVGANRLELLLFRLNDTQLYGINVFKVREVLKCPPLTQIPNVPAVVCGVANIRGSTISIYDLSAAIGMGVTEKSDDAFVIITEYNCLTQGFLVNSVDRIINMNWEAIHPPPRSAGSENYLTAVTRHDEALIEILDVEKVLHEINPRSQDISDGVVSDEVRSAADSMKVLIVDDSSVARRQLQRCIESMGLQCELFADGKAALEHLHGLLEKGLSPSREFLLMVSDIEMPEMDGYTLTSSIKSNPALADLHVILHTSLSGVFNNAMVEKVGADDFLAKFEPDQLAQRISECIVRAAWPV